MLTLEEIISAHLHVRSEESWDELACAVQENMEDPEPGFAQFHAYADVARSLGLDAPGEEGMAVALIGEPGGDGAVYVTDGQINQYRARRFTDVMEAYRRAMIGSGEYPDNHGPTSVMQAMTPYWLGHK